MESGSRVKGASEGWDAHPQVLPWVAQGRTWTGTPGLSKGSILVTWGHHDRSLPAGVLKQQEFIFTIPEAGCPRPRCPQGWLLPRLQGISPCLLQHLEAPDVPGFATVELHSPPPPPSQGHLFFLFFLIYFWLHWVFVTVHQLSLVGMSRGSSLVTEHGL